MFIQCSRSTRERNKCPEKFLDVNICHWSQIRIGCRVSQEGGTCGFASVDEGVGVGARKVCVCGPGYSSHMVSRCPTHPCLCWLTQFRSDTPLTCDTSLHISINTHLAQLQLNNNTHHYVATVFAKTVPVSMITVSLGPCLGAHSRHLIHIR